MSSLSPLNLSILRALDESHRTLLLPGHRWPAEILGLPDKQVERHLESLDRRGYCESGVSLRSGWLTEKGRDAVADKGAGE